MKITILYNLPENEQLEADNDTQVGAQWVNKILSENDFETTLLGINKSELEIIQNIETDVVFNLVEWLGNDFNYGVEVLKHLEKSGVAFTGSDSAGYALSADKVMMKKLMKKYKIPTPEYQVFETGNEKITKTLPYPVILKPAYEHCGIGITQNSLSYNENELKKKITAMLEKYRQPIIAEEYIDGRELHVTVLEKNGKPWVLPPAEVVFQQEKGYVPILSYDCKWKEDSWEFDKSRVVVAELDVKLRKKIERICEQCYVKMGGRDYPRIDIRLRGRDVYVLEVNTNPGIECDVGTGIKISTEAAGLTPKDLLISILENAYSRVKKKTYATSQV